MYNFMKFLIEFLLFLFYIVFVFDVYDFNSISIFYKDIICKELYL